MLRNNLNNFFSRSMLPYYYLFCEKSKVREREFITSPGWAKKISNEEISYTLELLTSRISVVITLLGWSLLKGFNLRVGDMLLLWFEVNL